MLGEHGMVALLVLDGVPAEYDTALKLANKALKFAVLLVAKSHKVTKVNGLLISSSFFGNFFVFPDGLHDPSIFVLELIFPSRKIIFL